MSEAKLSEEDLLDYLLEEKQSPEDFWKRALEDPESVLGAPVLIQEGNDKNNTLSLGVFFNFAKNCRLFVSHNASDEVWWSAGLEEKAHLSSKRPTFPRKGRGVCLLGEKVVW